MKKIDYYMALPYKLEIVPDAEGGYVARYPELVNHVLDAKREWLLAALEDGIRINEPASADNYSG